MPDAQGASYYYQAAELQPLYKEILEEPLCLRAGLDKALADVEMWKDANRRLTRNHHEHAVNLRRQRDLVIEERDDLQQAYCRVYGEREEARQKYNELRQALQLVNNAGGYGGLL